MTKKNIDLSIMKTEAIILSEMCEACIHMDFERKLSLINKINKRVCTLLETYRNLAVDLSIIGNSIYEMEYTTVIFIYNDITVYCDVATGDIQVEI